MALPLTGCMPLGCLLHPWGTSPPRPMWESHQPQKILVRNQRGNERKVPCKEHQILISFLPLFLEVWQDNSRKTEVERKPITEEVTAYKGEMEFAENKLQAFGSSLWRLACRWNPTRSWDLPAFQSASLNSARSHDPLGLGSHDPPDLEKGL